MPNDYITLKALACELNETIRGGKIEKIYQPEKDEILLIVKTAKERHFLTFSCNAASPRIHLSSGKKENPITAPAFCMMSRKYLLGGQIQSVKMLNRDRIFEICIGALNELKDAVTYTYIVELMGRYSNILLVNQDGKIMDSLKRISFDTATKRCILPGVAYAFPPAGKPAIEDENVLRHFLQAFTGDDLAESLAKSLGGISAPTAREIVALAGLTKTDKALSSEEIEKVVHACAKLLSPVQYGIFQPAVSLKNGAPDDYFIFPYRSMETEFLSTDSLNHAVELCIGAEDAKERHRERAKPLNNVLKNYRKRTEKRLQKAQEKLAECENIPELQKTGELILNNLFRHKKGENFLTATDYETGNEVVIDLHGKTPQTYAQELFKRYAKLKRTAEIVGTQISELNGTLQYIQSIEYALGLASSAQDYAEIEHELKQAGAQKTKSSAKRQEPKSRPITHEIDGFMILTGKNNLQNEMLTFKQASKSDLWFHALGYHGSHTVILSGGTPVPDTVIAVAAEIATHYSQGNSAGKVPCDYTQVRHVKKHPGGARGMVTYTHQQTVYATPNPHIDLQIKK